MPPLTLSTALTTWRFAPFVSATLAALALAYLTGAGMVARRAAARWSTERARGRRAGAWPAVRTVSFLCGLAVIAVATQGSPGVYDDELLTAHMVQHLLLIMVAPPLLVFGRPVTLLLHATRNPWHSRVKRAVRSRVVAALTWPPFGVALYSAVVLCTHLTGLLGARGAPHDLEHVAYLLAGYLFFLPVIGSEPARWRVGALGRYLLLLAAMPADIATGAVLMLRGPLYGYGGGDVRAGGLVMLAGSDLIMTALAVAVAVAVVRDRGGRRGWHGRQGQPADLAADLAAYNAYLASLRPHQP
jgi:cytochrome c oxidase assembly factor CtaG